MSDFLVDTFTDPDGYSLGPVTTEHTGETGASWDSGGFFVIQSNRVWSAVGGVSFASGTPASTEYDVIFLLYVASKTGDVGVHARMTVPNNETYYLARHTFASDTWDLVKANAASYTTLGTFVQSLTVGQTYTVKLEIREASKKLYVDGVEIISSADNAVTSAGHVALRASAVSSSTGGHFASITGTNAAAPAPSAGTASYVSNTSSSITVTTSGTSGGTGSRTVQWMRSLSPTSGFSNLSGATTDTWTDTTPTVGVTYFYKLVVTDSLAATGTSNYAVGRTAQTAPGIVARGTIKIGAIGTSITAGLGVTTAPVATLKTLLENDGYTVTVVNRGLTSSSTADWLSGGSAANAALAAFTGAGMGAGDYVQVELGANDGANGISAATYDSNLADIIGWITGAGYKAVLHYTTWFAGITPPYDDAANAITVLYQAKIDARVNGTTVLQGDRGAFLLFAHDPSLLQGDGTHPDDGGAAALAALWKTAYEAPSVPTAPVLDAITGLEVGSTGILVEPTAPSSNGGSAIIGYRIYANKNSGGATLAGTLAAANLASHYLYTGSVSGDSVAIYVTAYNAIGESAASATRTATSQGPPVSDSGTTEFNRNSFYHRYKGLLNG